MEVVAKRKFKEGEVVVLFWGRRLEENPNKVTQYALETKHGIFDPQRGLGGTGDDAYLMGLHVITETIDDLKANVTVSENLLFTAMKSISENELLFFKFETTSKNIWRPQIKSLRPSTDKKQPPRSDKMQQRHTDKKKGGAKGKDESPFYLDIK
jgi:hypothetical protein